MVSMLKSERGVVKPPNDQTKAPIGSSGPLGREASPIMRNDRSDRRMGSYPLTGGASAITEAQNRDWKVGTSSEPEMATTVEPGKGSVPINPGIGGRIGSMPIADMAKAR